jgi:undecaprenyl diphosphate synthase
MTNAQKVGLSHIGFVVDGNRRWAREKGLPTFDGHKKGYEVLKEMAYAAQERDIKYVSSFIFSTENWSRSADEIGYLMDLFLWAFRSDMKQLIKDGFRVIFLGRREGLRAKICAAIEKTEKDSAHNTGTTLALCFNYGGQAEIADGARNVAAEIIGEATKLFAKADVTAEEAHKKLLAKLHRINEKTFANYLYHPELPPLDLLVRTSGEERLSGFHLWRAAYAELLFLDKMWPDMTADDLDFCIDEFATRQRRFGK